MTKDVDTNPISETPEAVEGIQEAEALDEDQKPVFNKIQVGDVVRREREKAYDKGRREALMELQQSQQVPDNIQQSQVQPGINQGLGGMPPQMSHDDVRRIMSEEIPNVLQEQFQQLQTKQLVESFVEKMNAAETRHPGLKEKLNKLDYTTLAPVVQAANNMENTADVMKELVDNPMKMGQLITLMREQPLYGNQAIQDLSNSIKLNQQATAEESQAKNPLSQLKPSSSAGMDDSKMSVRDFQSMFRGNRRR